jgi:hypothetical protein
MLIVGAAALASPPQNSSLVAVRYEPLRQILPPATVHASAFLSSPGGSTLPRCMKKKAPAPHSGYLHGEHWGLFLLQGQDITT